MNLPVLHIIHIMFRDSQNSGSIQKFLSLVVFLEEFHPYFLLVPVQNNFRSELSLRRNQTISSLWVSLRVAPNFEEPVRRVKIQTTSKNTGWYCTPKRQELLKRTISYLLSDCFFSLYSTYALFLLYFVQLDNRAQLFTGTLDKQCNATKLLMWICPFCV